RLSAGREVMNDELQALCFLAGANSIFYGEKLLTTGNPDVARDRALMTRPAMATRNPVSTCTDRDAHTNPPPLVQQPHAARRGSAEGCARRPRATQPPAATTRRQRR